MITVAPAGTPDKFMVPLFVTAQESTASDCVRSVPPVPVILMLPARLSYKVTGVSEKAGVARRRTVNREPISIRSIRSFVGIAACRLFCR